MFFEKLHSKCSLDRTFLSRYSAVFFFGYPAWKMNHFDVLGKSETQINLIWTKQVAGRNGNVGENAQSGMGNCGIVQMNETRQGFMGQRCRKCCTSILRLHNRICDQKWKSGAVYTEGKPAIFVINFACRTCCSTYRKRKLSIWKHFLEQNIVHWAISGGETESENKSTFHNYIDF